MPDLGYSYSIFNFDERPLTDVISEKVGGYRVSIDISTATRTIIHTTRAKACKTTKGGFYYGTENDRSSGI